MTEKSPVLSPVGVPLVGKLGATQAKISTKSATKPLDTGIAH